MKSKSLGRLKDKRDRAQALLDLVDAAKRLTEALEYRDRLGYPEGAAEDVAIAYRALEELS